jgi:hypothetical protein
MRLYLFIIITFIIIHCVNGEDLHTECNNYCHASDVLKYVASTVNVQNIRNYAISKPRYVTPCNISFNGLYDLAEYWSRPDVYGWIASPLLISVRQLTLEMYDIFDEWLKLPHPFLGERNLNMTLFDCKTINNDMNKLEAIMKHTKKLLQKECIGCIRRFIDEYGWSHVKPKQIQTIEYPEYVYL